MAAVDDTRTVVTAVGTLPPQTVATMAPDATEVTVAAIAATTAECATEVALHRHAGTILDLLPPPPPTPLHLNLKPASQIAKSSRQSAPASDDPFDHTLISPLSLLLDSIHSLLGQTLDRSYL